ncbi:hypothetical protein K440DRAFT_626234 [Wilcoxina mikolae CBS 423.85]|nr:hypothetical protein K440DRAFT_626234 [Wilcoxina mikolae CBS 423.85]
MQALGTYSSWPLDLVRLSRDRYETSTQSLSSSVQEYIFENGRRYHAYFGVDKNPLPTDEA